MQVTLEPQMRFLERELDPAHGRYLSSVILLQQLNNLQLP